MPLRQCLDCGVWSSTSRCPRCKRRRKARRNADRRVAADVVAAWRAEHGDWCPGWRRPGHAASDLTAEHGANEVGSGKVAGVLCRSCNSAKRDRG